MAGFNRIEIIGNLGKDPETRTTTTGKMVCSFSVGVTERKDAATQWFNVQVWDKLAEICSRYLKKGSSVMVAGRMASRKYEKDGVTREAWEIVAREVLMLGGKAEGATGDRRTYKAGDPVPEMNRQHMTTPKPVDDDCSLPF